MSGDGGRNWLLIKEKDEHAAGGRSGDIVGAQPDSVLTGRPLESIADDGDHVWQSDRSVDPTTGVTADPVPAPPESRSKSRRKAASARASQPPSISPSTLPGARKRRQPDFQPAQLATLVTEPPAGAGWLHEIKFDGYRFLAHLSAGKARLLTRNNRDWTKKLGWLAREIEAIGMADGVLDGELAAVREDGITDFGELKKTLNGKGTLPVFYYLFDIAHCNGYDLTAVPLLERKQLLRRLLDGLGPDSPHIRYSDHIEGSGETVIEHACRHHLEGVISKRADSAYEGRRSRTWLKIRCGHSQEFVVGGFTRPQGTRKGFGALLLGYYDGDALIYAGRVGTGFDDELLREITAELKTLRRDCPAFADPPRGAEARGVTWVEPRLVGEVAYTEWTEDGRLRHPSFKGLRIDKDPLEVTREQPVASAAVPAPARAEKSKESNDKPKSGKNAGKARSADPSTIAGIVITKYGRAVYPEQGATKLDLAHYYDAVADWILPHIADRPLTLVRCPQGRARDCFYQKHLTEALPDAVRGVPIKEDKGDAVYILIDDRPGLIALVQFGALELHPWASRADRVERPDRLFFDLDPGEGVAWPAIRDAAQLMRDRLATLGLVSFLKTTGGKGLHVVAPLARRHSFDEVKSFAKAIAEAVAREHPRDFVASMSKARRRGRIYIDYLRNGRGATAIAPYSTRARAGATVSVPLRWDELDDLPRPDYYNIESVLERLDAIAADPWADFLTLNQSITKAMKAAAGEPG